MTPYFISVEPPYATHLALAAPKIGGKLIHESGAIVPGHNAEDLAQQLRPSIPGHIFICELIGDWTFR
jgi:hypothetical protein